MRNGDPCTNCGSFEFKDGRHNSYFCSRKCYIEWNFSKTSKQLNRRGSEI